MAGTAVLGRLTWQVGRVVAAVTETPHVKSLTLEVPAWSGHRAGQHVDLRLTADDGYQAVRSYSIASPPEVQAVVVTVERLDDGEVSPYLVNEVRVDDQIEVRGPIGGYFVWEISQGGPVFLVAGGSGIVPLMAIIRHRQACGSEVPMSLLYSTRSPDDVIYRAELEELASKDGVRLVHTYTREQPPGWTGYSRRIDESLLRTVAPKSEERPLIYICGPTALVEGAASGMVALGHDPARIRTERFGPTGR
jgi:ferredoxin-NADP reductase